MKDEGRDTGGREEKKIKIQNLSQLYFLIALPRQLMDTYTLSQVFFWDIPVNKTLKNV